MTRRDQYGTHDDHHAPHRERSAGHRARDEQTVERTDRPRKGPNYGNSAERAARTTGGGRSEFQGRDFERENYGGGYGNQRATRDVPAAGRKGEWMHHGRGEPAWRGQAAGNGLDGLASERAFGSDADQQMSATDHDTAYRRWRDAQLQGHDDNYRAWRREQQDRYDQDYARSKAGRGRPKGRP